MAVDDVHLGVALEVAADVVQRARQQQVVGVEERHDLAAGVLEAEIDRVRLAVVVAHLVVVQPLGVALEHLGRVVGRAAVLHDVFEARVVLVDDAVDRAVEEVALVVRRGDDRDHRRVAELDLLVVAPRQLHRLRIVVVEAPEAAREEPIADPRLVAADEAQHPQPHPAQPHLERPALAALRACAPLRAVAAAEGRGHEPERRRDPSLQRLPPADPAELATADLGHRALKLGDLRPQRLELAGLDRVGRVRGGAGRQRGGSGRAGPGPERPRRARSP